MPADPSKRKNPIYDNFDYSKKIIKTNEKCERIKCKYCGKWVVDR